MAPAHLRVLMNTSLGIGTLTCGVDDVFTPGDMWFDSDSYANCAPIHNVCLDV